MGAGTAAVFARAGWNVSMAARSADRLQDVANSLTDASGHPLPVPTDVVDPDAVDALVAKTLDAFGQVDVLVNNAAIEHPGSIEDLTGQNDEPSARQPARR
ncbi:MAG: SDR family NAD(P)-dependent oxidoreductase, partial [Actinomycetota bacterium]|nr:SDR family NAD(P)-dependent oxidoreductase [Actinomycetota bacterium]